MFNMEKLVKLGTMMLKAATNVRYSYFGKKYFMAIRQRLDMAKVDPSDYTTPIQVELSNSEYQELLDMYERGKGHEETAFARIGKEFTVLYFDVDADSNKLYIQPNHLELEEVKELLQNDLWAAFYRFMITTHKQKQLTVGFDHRVLPDLYTKQGNVSELITEIYLQKSDIRRFLDLMLKGVIGTVKETTIDVYGLKYDQDFATGNQKQFKCEGLLKSHILSLIK